MSNNSDERSKMTPPSILKIYDEKTHDILCKQSNDVILSANGLAEARFIAEQLRITLEPFMPAAGLAAPQIGYSKRLFIWSWNRSKEQMDTAINPVITDMSDDQESWEACLSALQDEGECQAARLSRACSIKVHYYNLDGKLIKKHLTGFAAKVFQHEYDHLLGIVCVRKAYALVKSFPTLNQLKNFMITVKSEDSLSYIKPESLS